uniref:cytosolic carboxypeptidase 1-like isoform X1 n=2 Tax=Ciona intestinalis TaxID=7719 RepID=UPI000180C3E5|nr:cytosolic carboxypeptidase 1-like isoform X1 [Ciona intestinalis]|eukprot:XP_002124627.1 cytosolic carboxypeptidase 1-like isoform X1 [Ciona intestinalis]
MSAKASKAAETRSKAKSVITMLEKLNGSSNPDKEQTRYLSQKLLQIVNTKESSKKDVTCKSGLEAILLALENSQDHPTCMALVNTLAEIANEGGGSVKRLIGQDTTRVLLHMLAYLGSDVDWRLLSCILALLAKLGPKDRRFALRARLTGSLSMILSAVRSSYTHHSRAKMLQTSLTVLKLTVLNSTSNSILLGRAGAVNVLSRVVLSSGKKQPVPLKTALAVLNLLIRSSRANASRAVSLGLISSILGLHCDYHKSDIRHNRHTAIRKSFLNILKNITALKIGRKSFNEANGLLVMYNSCRDYLAASHTNNKSVDPLLTVATMIIRRCQPKSRLPILNSRSTIRFRLPGMEEPDLLEDDFFALTDEEEDENVEDPPVDGEELNDNCQPSDTSASKSSTATSDVNRDTFKSFSYNRSDLKMYEDFFPELQDFKLQNQLLTQRPHTSGEADKPHFNPRNVARHSSPDLTKLSNSWEVPCDVSDVTKTFADVIKVVDDSEKQVTNCNGLTHSSGDEAKPKPKAWSVFYDSSTINGDMMTLPITNNIFSHDNSPSMLNHNSHYELAQKLAQSTISVKEEINKLSLADEYGSVPMTKSEHQVNKRNVQRLIKSKLLDDLARSLFPDDVINDVIYSCDDVTPGNPVTSYNKDIIVKRENGEIQSCEVHEPNEPVNGTYVVTEEIKQENKLVIQVTIPNNETSETSDDISSTTISEETWPGVYIDQNDNISTETKEKHCMKLPLNNRIGTNQRLCSSNLKFDSKFESGNLRAAVQVREFEYDLVLNSDCNSLHHYQWFYFEVSNMKMSQTYRFNIVNCEKKGSLINEGMQPVMYSMVEAKQGRPCWRRVGHDTCYYRNHFLRSKTTASTGKNRTYFTLSFTVNFQYVDDVCYFAYHYPYTYTQLKVDLQNLMSNIDTSTMYVRQQTLCNTLSGNSVPVLTITSMPISDNAGSAIEAVHELRSRPYIFLSARVHPGETNASWTMRGTLKLLLTPPASQDQPEDIRIIASIAEDLRKSYIFKIIPMLNPDGVINGHHRCSLSGEDLNRTWLDPNPQFFPTIYHTKGLLQYLQSIQKAPLVYCDYHGHSRKMNVFMYGCSHKDSAAAGETSTTVGGPDDTGFKTLPKLLNHFAPSFSLKGCSYVVEKSKVTTARVVVWKEIGVARSYTMESTYCGCDQGRYRGLQVGTKELEEMGARFVEVLLHLKARNQTRGLPVIDTEDEVAIEQPDCDVIRRDISPGCPVNSDAELTPDEDDLSPIDTSLFSHDFTQDRYPTYMVEHQSMNNDPPSDDLSFWRYDPHSISRDNQASTSSYMYDSNVYNPLATKNLHKDQKVITAHVSPDTGRLLYYQYSDAETTEIENDLVTVLENDVVTTAPRPFESGLTLQKEKRNPESYNDGKSTRPRRKSQKR